MTRLSDRISREGQPCIPTLGLERCPGIYKSIGIVRQPNLESDYLLISECNECKKRVYDAVDTEDGRIELVETI